MQPDTSRAAREQFIEDGKAPVHYAKIRAALSVLGQGTAYHIAERCGLDRYQVARRISEMEDVVDTGDRESYKTKTRCKVYRLAA